MSTYDRIKAETSPAPAYPRKGDFTTIYGYKGGVVLGSFPSVSDAKAAGASTTDSTLDDEAYQAVKNAYDSYHADISSKWYEAVRAEYPEVNDAVFNLVYDLAYDRGHSAGMGEVELYIADYAEFAVKVMEASK